MYKSYKKSETKALMGDQKKRVSQLASYRKTLWSSSWNRPWSIAIQSYLKKQETPQINNLTLHLKQLEKEEPKKPKVSRRKETIKIRTGINEKGMKETIPKSIKLKAGSLRR